MAEHELDALIVAGSEYSGFEGSVTYLSGFQIVHRYAYVLLPAYGEPQIVFPSDNSRSTIAAGALEMSNVDLTQEFTNMIVAQRGFQANGRVITSTDEMLQEVVNLKR